jgi:uncharacterized protein (TIGR03437 family)
LKRVLSISHLILPLFAFASATCLSAQTIVVDKASLAFSGQFGGSAVTQTLNVTSTGASIPFILVVPPGSSWLKVNGQATYGANTPAAATVTADPAGLSAGTYAANIAVFGGSDNNPSIAVTFTVSAIGVSPASLALSYTFGSSTFPALQVLTLTGAATQCTATAASTSGGNWFSLLQSSCASPGNLAVVFNNAVIAGLAPNTYSGTITIAPVPAGQTPAVVVPVTLTVVPTPPVTVNPPSLFFNWQTGIAAPNPSQTFTVSTTAGQALTYSFTTSVDTGSWISTVVPPSGTISSTTGTVQITVTLNPNGLAAGTYKGKLTLLTPGGSPTQQDIPVQLVVSNAPLLNVPNATLNFAYQLGTSAPAAQTVNITATSGILSYAVTQSSNSPWLSVPNAGNTTTPLTVSVNPAGLTPGTYTATVNVTSATPGSAAQPFPVVLKVTDDPVISASVGELKFPYQIGQSAPVVARSVKIASSTGVVLNYTASLATTNCGSAWLLLNGAGNTISGATPDTLTVSIATAGLAAGTCTGTITINATNPATGAAAVGSPIAIPVTLTVSTTAQLVLSPADPPLFTVGVGAQSPAPQTITLTSTNADVLTYTVSFTSNNTVNWLFVNTVSGSTAANNNSLTVFVVPGSLIAGSYAGTVTVTATGPGGAAVANSPVVIPITLNVTAGSLTVSASDLSFQQTLGGPAPASQTVTIGSSGQTLNYNALANSNTTATWLTVSPASGNTSTSGTLTVTVDGSRLTAGTTYHGTIVVTSPGAGNSPATINVHFKVDPGTLSANPSTTLTFTQAAAGAAPPSQSIAVSGSPAPLNFTVATATLNGVNWLSATPATGTTPSSVQVLVNGNVLPVGQYTGTVTIASTGANGSPINVGVVLNVVAPAVLVVAPTSLTFNYTVGVAAPPAQNLTVTSTGATGIVPFSVQVQFDGTIGQWLQVTPTMAAAPSTLAVSIATAGLTAGTYTGRIVITSPNALVVANIPVTLNVAAVPQPVVSDVKNAASYSTGAVSPGENVWIGGTGLGPATLVSATPVNNVFPTLVGATRVLFDGTAAPIIYASATQTSVMVPYGVAGRTTTNIVVEYSGVQSATLAYNVVAAAPGLYTLNSQGTGQGAVLNQDGVTVNGVSTPEKRGNVIAIYMTGEGQTVPGGVDGVVIPPVVSALKHPVLPVTVTIGGIDAPVLYAGSAPSLISGVMQVNVTIPLAVAAGTQPVVVTVGTTKSQSGASAATVVVQ